MENGSLFCDIINVPHIAYLIDPFFRFLDLTESPRMILTCDDQEGCEMLKARGFNRTIFMPHAVEQELKPDPEKIRIYDIAYFGTCIELEKRRSWWKKEFSHDIFVLMEEAVKAGLDEDQPSFMKILSEQLNPMLAPLIFQEVELYIKGADRLDLLRAFPDSEIHVFGNDEQQWKDVLFKNTNIIIHPPLPFDKVLEVMKQTRIVLNSSIKNKFGAHERIFSAAACGAVVVTNDNPFMRESFTKGKELLLYNRKQFPKINEQVKELLKNESKRVHIAKAGRERVMAGHTWDHRAKYLLKEAIPMLKQINSSKKAKEAFRTPNASRSSKA
jgi:glycosyltransferase involved in cell wall biosynthesis